MLDEAVAGLNSGNEVDITRVDERPESVEGAAARAEELLCAASIAAEVVVIEAVGDDLVTETEIEEKERLVGTIGFTPTAGTAPTTPPLLDVDDEAAAWVAEGDCGLEDVGPANVVDSFLGICLSLVFLAT